MRGKKSWIMDYGHSRLGQTLNRDGDRNILFYDNDDDYYCDNFEMTFSNSLLFRVYIYIYVHIPTSRNLNIHIHIHNYMFTYFDWWSGHGTREYTCI